MKMVLSAMFASALLAFLGGLLAVMLVPPVTQFAGATFCGRDEHIRIYSESCSDSEGEGTCYHAACTSARGVMNRDSEMRIYLGIGSIIFVPLFLVSVGAGALRKWKRGTTNAA